MKVFLRQIYSYGFCILKLKNLKVIHDLYSQCLTQTLSKTIFFSSMEGVPIALRKPNRSSNIPTRLKDYVGYKHDIANFMSYKNCSSSFQSFIASLDSTSIPTN